MVATLGVLIFPAGAIATGSVIPGVDSAAATGSADRVGAADGDQPSVAGWQLDDAKAAVAADVISRVDGAPGYIDVASVSKALAGSDIRVVFLPFTGLGKAERDAASTQNTDLDSWASGAGYRLIEVRGLSVAFSPFVVSPSDLPELEPVLAQFNVTHQVLFAVAHLLEKEEPGDTVNPQPVVADAVVVQTIGDALAAGGVYNEPGMASPEARSDSWATAGTGLAVRAAFLPATTPGQPLNDLIGPLHARFPDDVVIVARGRWLDAAGPDQDVVHSALLWVYGSYEDKVLEWEISPGTLVRLTAEQIALLRTGVTSGETAPAAPADPVASASAALPWIFGGVVVVVVIGSSAYFVTRTVRRHTDATDRRRSTADQRRKLGARLSTIAEHIVDIEPLAQGGSAAADVGVALERYRFARDALTGEEFDAGVGASDSSVRLVEKAIAEAEKRLVAVAKTLGVPLATPAVSNGVGR